MAKIRKFTITAEVLEDILALPETEMLSAFRDLSRFMLYAETPSSKAVIDHIIELADERKRAELSQKRSDCAKMRGKGTTDRKNKKAAKTAEKVAVSEFDVQALILLEKFRKYFNLFASKSGEYWQLDELTDIQSAQLNGLFKKFGEQTVFNECQKALNGQPSDIDFSFLKP